MASDGMHTMHRTDNRKRMTTIADSNMHMHMHLHLPKNCGKAEASVAVAVAILSSQPQQRAQSNPKHGVDSRSVLSSTTGSRNRRELINPHRPRTVMTLTCFIIISATLILASFQRTCDFTFSHGHGVSMLSKKIPTSCQTMDESNSNNAYAFACSSHTAKATSPCRNMDGILFISRVIRKAGAGTMFFQSIVDSLLYAKKYNLLPYIWINDDENEPCYDPIVHGGGSGDSGDYHNNISFHHILTGSITNRLGQGSMKCDTADGTRPGPPSFYNLVYSNYTIRGNGLWQSYFYPLHHDHYQQTSMIRDNTNRNNAKERRQEQSKQSALQFPLYMNDHECSTKPIFEMTRSQVMPDMHRCSELAVRGWAFRGIPKALLPHSTSSHSSENDNDKTHQMKEPTKTTRASSNSDSISSIQDWLWDHRQRAAPIVKQYFHLLPWLQELVDKANPIASSTSITTANEGCLAAHIRLTDKASGRDKKGLEAYRPYIEAYANAISSLSVTVTTKTAAPTIYIATDDASVLPTIQKKWSKLVAKNVISQPGAFRSDEDKLPTFKLLAQNKHRSNTEALVDIYSMSKCNYFVHGYSGMAEAVVYINPQLHARSINIDDDDNRMTPKEWENLVRSREDPRAAASSSSSFL